MEKFNFKKIAGTKLEKLLNNNLFRYMERFSSYHNLEMVNSKFEEAKERKGKLSKIKVQAEPISFDNLQCEQIPSSLSDDEFNVCEIVISQRTNFNNGKARSPNTTKNLKFPSSVIVSDTFSELPVQSIKDISEESGCTNIKNYKTNSMLWRTKETTDCFEFKVNNSKDCPIIPNLDVCIKAKTYDPNPALRTVDHSRNASFPREFKSCSKCNRENCKDSRIKQFKTIDVSIDTVEISFEIPVSTAEKPKRVNKSRISTSTQTTKRSPKIHEYPHSFNNEIINENIRQRIQLKLKTKSRFTNRNISKYTRVWESNNLGIPKVKINYDTLMNKIMKVKSDHGTSHWNFDGAQKLVFEVFIKLSS